MYIQYHHTIFSSVQFSHSDQIRSVAQSYPTLCDPMNCSMPGLPVHHQLPEFTETHIHRVSDAIHMAFIILRYVPSMLAFWRVFIINGWWILSKAFSASIEIIICFLSFHLLICCFTLNDFCILKNSFIPGINPNWSWCMSFLMCCWFCLLKFCWGILHLFSSVILACSLCVCVCGLCLVLVWGWWCLVEWIWKCSFQCNFLKEF